MGKSGLENREDSNFKNTSRHFWTIRSQSQGTEGVIITANIFQKQENFDCDIGGRNEACS